MFSRNSSSDIYKAVAVTAKNLKLSNNKFIEKALPDEMKIYKAMYKNSDVRLGGFSNPNFNISIF